MELIVSLLVSSIAVFILFVLTRFSFEMFSISTPCGIVFLATVSGIITMAAKRDA